MKKRILSTGKILLLTFLMLVFSVIIASPVPVTTRTNPKATVYLNPETTVYLESPTINGTVIDQRFNVSIMIRDAPDVDAWQAGLIFNATLLECTGFFEGEFLINDHPPGSTMWQEGNIKNAAGMISPPYACRLLGGYKTSGDGRLAYANFTVKKLGVSDVHLRDVQVLMPPLKEVPINIIDVYTVVVNEIPHKVVTVSNSTGLTGWYHSGFYAHAYNPALEEVSFNVTGPKPGFSNVTIPKTLFQVRHVRIDGIVLGTEEKNVTESATHKSVYFTYSEGIHKVEITSRMYSTILMTLSSTSITLRSNVTISGNITAEDLTARPYVNVTIQYKPVGAPDWDAAEQNLTDSKSNYIYTWKPGTGGTYNITTRWEGDNETLPAESDALLLTVLYVFKPEGVYIETNSTVAEFDSIPALNFSQPLKQISFNVTNPYGTKGYSNVTIPKTLLPPPEPPIEWKVVINGTLLSTEERTVTENDNTSIYFTYSKGINIVKITTRMNSTISLALSLDSIDLESSVTISGNITLEDNTMRPNANVTIHIYRSVYRQIDGTWSGLKMTETDENGNYTYPWEPEKAGIYEVMASWEGDNETIGDESDVSTLTVKESSTISIGLSSTSITMGSNVTISGAIHPMPWRPNYVAVQSRPIGGTWSSLWTPMTDQNGEYTYTWTPDTPGTCEVRATWLGDEITYNATSSVLTLTAKWSSIISIAISSTNITKGKSVTISGNITAADNIARANVTVTILHKLSGENWTTLDTVETDENGNYTYPWEPEKAGIYEVMASWEGDDITFGNESEAKTLEVKEAAVFPLMYVVAAVVAIIVIAAIAVYFVRFRKPR